MNTKQLHSAFKMRGDSDVSYLQHSIDEMISAFMKKKGIPGLTLAIVQAPYIPRVVGYGFSDQGRKLLSSPNTLYPIGPISQGFAAVALMQLYEDKKLDLADSVGSYLDVPESWRSLSLLTLLRHASGLPDYRLMKGFDYTKEYDLASIIALIKTQPLLFKSGSSYNESATDFYLLSEVIAKVSGMPYADFIKKRQIDYLGLRHTATKKGLSSFAVEDVLAQNTLHELFKKDSRYIDPSEPAASYDAQGKEIAKASASAFQGSADIYASAQDVSYWDIALAGSILIHEKSDRDLVYASWTNPEGKTIPAAAGWHFYHHRGLMAIRGSMPGFSSYLSRFTHSEELVCVTLLANKEGVDLTNLARRIAGAFGDYMSTNYDDNTLYLVESQFGVEESVARLKKGLTEANIPLFALIDHAENARKVGLTMEPNQVLVFGNPLAGTPLLIEDPSFGLDLPLKILVFQDQTGSTFMAFRRLELLEEEHGLQEDGRLAKMEALLERLVNQAADF